MILRILLCLLLMTNICSASYFSSVSLKDDYGFEAEFTPTD